MQTTFIASAVLLAFSLSGCTVISVAGTVVSTTASVAGTVISTTADVVGAGVKSVAGTGERQ